MMIMSAAAVLVVLMVMMLVVVLHLLHSGGQGIDALHDIHDLCAAQLRPGGGYDGRVGIELAEHGAGGDDLAVGGGIGAAEHDNVGVLHLVVEKFAEVADIHTALARVNDGDLRADLAAVDACDSLRNVGELAHARGLDDDAVGSVFGNDLFKRLGEVAHEGAADAAGVHLGYLHAGILEKAAVDGYLAELVLDEDELFVFIALGYQLAYKRGLSRAQKSGKNVYLSQNNGLQFKMYCTNNLL